MIRRKTMKKANKNAVVAKVLSTVSKAGLYYAANSRCAFVYHQPKQPEKVNKFRRF